MLDQIKKYKDLILMSIVIGISIYCVTLFVGKKVLTIQNEYLQKQQEALEKRDIELSAAIKELKDLRQQDLAANKESAIKIAKLETELKNATKPIDIKKAKTDDEVVSKIGSLYNDGSTKYDFTNFTVKKNTTYMMLYDAEQWKTNGPILQDNLDKSLALNSEYKIGIDLRDKTIENDTKLLNTFDASVKTKDELITNVKSQNVNLTRQLNLEKKSGKLKIVGGFLGGLVIYYVQDKIRHKKQ